MGNGLAPVGRLVVAQRVIAPDTFAQCGDPCVDLPAPEKDLAVHHALENLGFAGVEDVRVGRMIELEVADGTGDAALTQMCDKLLANTVIENYRIEKA